MSKGKLIQYRIRKRERVSLTYNGPTEIQIREYEVSYAEWYEVLKAEKIADEFGRTTNVWTVPI